MAAVPVWVEVAKGVASILQVLAIVVGGGWAYYRFVRGRVFKPRAEVEARADILEAPGEKAIRLDICFKNTGSVYIGFAQDKAALRGLVQVWGTDAVTGGSNPYWGDQGDELIVADVFTELRGCEPGETLHEQVLLPVPAAAGSEQQPWRALRIDVLVASPDRLGDSGKPKPWLATAILADSLMTRPVRGNGKEGSDDGTTSRG
jgi:hypothetical protein